ncbi:MAG: hypothetical protein WBD95_13655 [Xanthobacteraceae bacterium]
MAQDNPDGTNRDNNGGDEPAAEHHVIALAIKALNAKYEATQTERNQHDRKTLFWARTAGIGVSIYTLLTVGTVIAAICSAVIGRDTEQRQLRGYILPTQATIGITNANEVKATAIIKNFGQTPAYHFRFWACLAVRDFVVKDNTPVDPTDLQEWWKDISKLPQSTVPQQDIAHIREVFPATINSTSRAS